jgi:hypothetical protein
MSILKRQRELKKAEKAAAKRAKRHGRPVELAPEPLPTLGAAELLAGKMPPSEQTTDDPHEDPA